MQYLAEAAVDHPFAIAVWQERLYWSDWEHDHIRSCLKRTGKQTKLLVKGTHNNFFGLALYHPALMPLVGSLFRSFWFIDSIDSCNEWMGTVNELLFITNLEQLACDVEQLASVM